MILAVVVNIDSGAQFFGGYLCLILPFCLFAYSIQQVSQQWLIRNREYRIIRKINITHSFFLNAMKVLCGLFHPTSFVLILATGIGYLLHATLFFRDAKRKKIRIYVSKFRLREKEVLGKYSDFPKFRAPQVLLNSGV